MSDETRRVIFTVSSIGLFMVFYLIIMAVVGYVKGAGGVESMIDYTGYVVIAALIAGFLFAIIMLVARIFNMATRNIIEFQANDDKGEIARQAMKNIGDFENRVMKGALQLRQQMDKAPNSHRIVQDNAPQFDLTTWMQQAPQLETKGEYYELD